MNKDLTLSLPEELHEKLHTQAKESEFGSLDEYLSFVLEQFCEETSESDEPNSSEGSDTDFDEKEAEAQKKRLNELGYV